MRATRGFSLLELLVVLVIVALLSGTLVLSFGNRGDQLGEQQLQRLQWVLQRMCEQAGIEGRLLGLRLYSNAYVVQRPRTPLPPPEGPWQWQSMDSADYRLTQLADGYRFTLRNARGEAIALRMKSCRRSWCVCSPNNGRFLVWNSRATSSAGV
jgi:prepilin-type N-terminal cleavage/methylation domain-containing protein